MPADPNPVDQSGVVTLRSWTREELIALVEGRKALMRGADAEDLPVPEWLANHADVLETRDSTESVNTTHPDDRGVLVDSFLAAVVAPGEECKCTIRNQDDEDGWFLVDITWVNLLDHPDVGGILCTVERLHAVDVEAPVEVTSVESSATSWMILVVDDRVNILSARGASVEILGYETDDLVGYRTIDLIHPDGMGGGIDNWIALRTGIGKTRTSRQLWMHRDGSPVWVEVSFMLHEDDTTEMVVVDIRDRMANEDALVASQAEVAELAEDFRLVADEVPTPVFRCDADGRIDFRNSQWAETFPALSDAARLQDLFAPDGRESIDEALASDGVYDTRIVEALAADGERMLSLRCRPVGSDPLLRRFVGSITDISLTVRLRHEANHDALTGLANRTQIAGTLAAAMDHDPSSVLVVFVDLDGFKVVNDTCGHEVGDLVLVEVARRLAGSVRPGDLVGRHGGDEFVVICTGVAESDSTMIVERLRAGAFSEPIELPDGEWSSSASIGFARPEPGDDVARVLRRADQAMFAEKRVAPGRDR